MGITATNCSSKNCLLNLETVKSMMDKGDVVGAVFFFFGCFFFDPDKAFDTITKEPSSSLFLLLKLKLVFYYIYKHHKSYIRCLKSITIVMSSTIIYLLYIYVSKYDYV